MLYIKYTYMSKARKVYMHAIMLLITHICQLHGESQYKVYMHVIM